MKIWPFDPAAEASDGTTSPPNLDPTALEPFRKIRSAVGDRHMDIMVEFHSLWRLPMAQKIAARALASSTPSGTRTPSAWTAWTCCASTKAGLRGPDLRQRTLSYKWGFGTILQTGVAGVVMLDLSWCGGLKTRRRARSPRWPTPGAAARWPRHDRTGPVVWAASVTCRARAQCAGAESVRAFYSGWYQELVTELPRVAGHAHPER